MTMWVVKEFQRDFGCAEREVNSARKEYIQELVTSAKKAVEEKEEYLKAAKANLAKYEDTIKNMIKILGVE